MLGTVILKHMSENSVLDRAEELGLVPFVVTDRKRYATCSGVAWLGNHHLATVNLFGGHLRVYRFYAPHGGSGPRLVLLHELSENISFPEHVTASPDGSWLAVSHSMSSVHGISMHAVDKTTLAPSPAPSMLRVGLTHHGVCFSPDSRFLVYTRIACPAHIEVVHVASGVRAFRSDNSHSRYTPKGVAVSGDGCWLFVAYSPNAGTDPEKAQSGSLLTAHKFDADIGIFDAEPVADWHSTDDRLLTAECCKALPTRDDGRIPFLVVDQAVDKVLIFEFDPLRRTISDAGDFVTELSFPHAVDVSPNGEIAAVANLGDDSLYILDVSRRAENWSSFRRSEDVANPLQTRINRV